MDGHDRPPPFRVSLETALGSLPEAGRASSLLMRHGSLELKFFRPTESDPQLPHDRDELYIIAAGSGVFVRSEAGEPFTEDLAVLQGEERVAFSAGDALFVPAGRVHRFESFSADFAAWMIFYGPEGGEQG